MPLTPTQIAALKTELQTDPQALGYNAVARNDTAMSDEINFVRDGITPCPDNAVVGAAIVLPRTDVSPLELLQAIDIRDFFGSGTSITLQGQLQAEYINATLQLPRIPLLAADGVTKSMIRQNLDRAVVNAGQGSQARMDAVANRFGSRAEKLFGAGTSVTITDVGLALN